MFDFDISDELKVKIRKLVKKDRKRAEILNKKIKEIIQNNAESIDRCKNLKYGLSNYKRVHLDNHFVLTFRVDKENNFILFVDLEHHDNAY